MSAKFVVAHLRLSVLLAMLLLLSASTASATWLEDQTRRVISGSRSIAFDNTTLFTPDASGYYTTQYTRDFYYALSGTDAQFWDQREATRAARFTFDRQRADGAMPDKVAADGRVGWAPGAIDSPMSDHAWDNGAFAALMLSDLTSKWNSTSSASRRADLTAATIGRTRRRSPCSPGSTASTPRARGRLCRCSRTSRPCRCGARATAATAAARSILEWRRSSLRSSASRCAAAGEGASASSGGCKDCRSNCVLHYLLLTCRSARCTRRRPLCTPRSLQSTRRRRCPRSGAR